MSIENFWMFWGLSGFRRKWTRELIPHLLWIVFTGVLTKLVFFKHRPRYICPDIIGILHDDTNDPLHHDDDWSVAGLDRGKKLIVLPVWGQFC